MNQKGKGNDYFETPDYLYNQLNSIFNFTCDVACDAVNSKARFSITEKENSISPECGWGAHRCFCNPPFSKKSEFIKKAYYEVLFKDCPVCVMILPLNCMDTKVWHDYIEGRFHYEILRGRVSFIDPETRLPKSGNNSGTVIVYFKKKIKARWE